MKLIKMLRYSFINLLSDINSEKYWNSKLMGRRSWKKREQIYTNLIKYIPKSTKTLLDIGCASGDGCIIINSKLQNLKVHGCDFSSVGINSARKKSNKIKFFYMDVIKEKLSLNYDTILFISILEHLKEYDSVVKKCLKNCKWLIISCPYNERVSFLGFKPSEHPHSFKKDTFKDYGAKVYVEGKRIIYIIGGELKNDF